MSNMETDDVGQTEATNTDEDNSKRKLTKEEKKRVYGTSGNYPEPHATRREVLKEIHKLGKLEADLKEEQEELFTSALYSIIEETENPFSDILFLFRIAPDYDTNSRATIAGKIMRNFQGWLDKQDPDDVENLVSRCLNRDVQVNAFKAATTKHVANLQVVSSIYRFSELTSPEDRQFVLGCINDLIKNLEFKSAMDVVADYGLCSEFGIHEFVIPCLLQDQGVFVTAYLKDNNLRSLQEEYVMFLDSFIGLPEKDVIAFFDQYKFKKRLSMARLIDKGAERLITKQLQEFHLDESVFAPRFHRHRAQGRLRFRFQSRFMATAATVLNDKAYFDVIKEELRDADNKLRLYYIDYLWMNNQPVDAVRWIMYFKMKIRDLPYRIQQYLEHNPDLLDTARNQLHEVTSSEALVMVLKDVNKPIEMIDTAENLRHMIDDIAQSELIGIDSEWRSQKAGVSESISIMQIATNNFIYLVDFTSLEQEKLPKADWELFIRALLCGNNTKLGFDFMHDIRALFSNEETMSLKDIENEMQNVVCIKRLVENLLEADETFIDIESVRAQQRSEDDSGCVGIHFKLSELSLCVCGITLDKTQQVSNWSLRPLRNEQIQYAAMDAYVLLLVYEKIREIAGEKGLEFDSVLSESHVNSKRKEKEKRKREKERFDDLTWAQIVEEMNTNVVGSVTQPKRADELKCVVDTMLLGLAKHLRRVGVDVLIPERKTELVRMMRSSPNRYAISCGKSFEELRQMFRDRTICVQNANKLGAIEQVKYVLTMFGVQLQSDDIFSRCMDCNEMAFVRAPAPVLVALHEAYVKRTCALFEDEKFPVKEWREKLSQIESANHKGFGCHVLPSDEDDLSVLCDGGIVNIVKCLVIHERKNEGVVVQVQKVPEEVIKVRTCFFYICGGCGRIFWDGSHISNYTEVANELIEATRQNFESPEEADAVDTEE